MLAFFLQGVALALPNVVVPSSFKIFLISRALATGWRRTLPAVLVPFVTDIPIMLLTLLLLSQLPTWFIYGLRILGGLFVMLLAWRIFKLWQDKGAQFQATEQAARRTILEALGINLLNPNPYLLWLFVAGPIMLTGLRQSTEEGISFFVGLYGVFVLGLALMVIIFGKVGEISLSLNRVIGIIATVALALLGAYQIWLGVTGFIA